MQRMAFSTDDVPEAERFSYWREAVGEGLLGTSAERNKGQETPFNARVDASIGASFARFRFRTDGYPVFRRPRDIARLSWDDYFCLYRGSGRRRLVWRGSTRAGHRARRSGHWRSHHAVRL